MQRLGSSAVLRAVRQLPIQYAVSPLPGLQQLAVPAYLCSLYTSVPSITANAARPSGLINLRSFAAEACRNDDPQTAAEALFKNRDSFPATVHQSVAHPFFARAYYVGELQARAAVVLKCTKVEPGFEAFDPMQAIQSIFYSSPSEPTRWDTSHMLARGWY